MKRLAIVGASGHGKVVADAAELCGWDVFFYDDFATQMGRGRWVINGTTQDLLQDLAKYEGVVVAIGNNKLRAEISKKISSGGGVLAAIVHPSAIVSRYAFVGDGAVVMAGAVVNADAEVGRFCILNTGVTVDHDCVLGDGVHVSPGCNVAGGVFVGDGAWLGIGSCVKECVKIGSHAVIGAGATVLKDVPANKVVYGVPAKLS